MEAVYSALREGPPAVAETELTAFLVRYPEDGVARYHRSVNGRRSGKERV